MSEAKRYVKKPVEIEAAHYGPSPADNDWIEDWLGDSAWFDEDTNEFVIDTLEGTMRAKVGDYIIKGIKGEFYPCAPDIFAESYSEVV